MAQSTLKQLLYDGLDDALKAAVGNEFNVLLDSRCEDEPSGIDSARRGLAATVAAYQVFRGLIDGLDENNALALRETGLNRRLYDDPRP